MGERVFGVGGWVTMCVRMGGSGWVRICVVENIREKCIIMVC